MSFYWLQRCVGYRVTKLYCPSVKPRRLLLESTMSRCSKKEVSGGCKNFLLEVVSGAENITEESLFFSLVSFFFYPLKNYIWKGL